MATKRHKPEEIVTKLRQVEVLAIGAFHLVRGGNERVQLGFDVVKCVDAHEIGSPALPTVAVLFWSRFYNKRGGFTLTVRREQEGDKSNVNPPVETNRSRWAGLELRRDRNPSSSMCGPPWWWCSG